MIRFLLLIVALIILIFSLFLVYTGIVGILQDVKHLDQRAAKNYLKEVIKDYYHNRSSFKLEKSEFPIKVKNDIEVYLSETDFARWYKRFFMISEQMEEAGYTDAGLPYYSFKLLCKTEDESKSVYTNIIRKLCWSHLKLAHCTECRVIVEWRDTVENDFKICTIIYARSAREQLTFLKYAEYLESRNRGTGSRCISDPDLNKEIEAIKKGMLHEY